ncbi:hypothetical protein [Desulfoscipio geothermicus]|uniref:Uncharacterized protein n=1 Tax=Desulfoscipio geothermicus DSM 3669 TaxID=1121426 RepID=A0A1I6DAZ1_9FIRM|nr:hypothetical protein [Desulfoscipio geothermicus]SFR02599.1 hypothetical protein SAMN05660706_10832 [Desulfoscipio geothermicus DSM 3669]
MKNNKSTVSGKYIFFVGLLSFIFAASFFLLSEFLSRTINSLLLSFIFLSLIILFGIISDIIGTSVAAASEVPFHAKASKRVPGAREGVFLIRNADRVANVANDVIGDIAGTVSGALGIALVLRIMSLWEDANRFILNMLITALIAAFTVGGKAYGKKIALSRSNDVIFLVGRIMAMISSITGINFVKK